MKSLVDFLNMIIKKYFIYFVSFNKGKIIKIGYTTNPISRFRGLCYENIINETPDGYLEIYAFDNEEEAREHERNLHDQYKKGMLYTTSSCLLTSLRYNCTDYFETEKIYEYLTEDMKNRLDEYR